MQDVGAWIIYPKQISIVISKDNKGFKEVYLGSNTLTESDKTVTIKNMVTHFAKQKIQYIKIIARQYGTLPAWHLGAGGQSHIFVDEISVK